MAALLSSFLEAALGTGLFRSLRLGAFVILTHISSLLSTLCRIFLISTTIFQGFSCLLLIGIGEIPPNWKLASSKSSALLVVYGHVINKDNLMVENSKKQIILLFLGVFIVIFLLYVKEIKKKNDLKNFGSLTIGVIDEITGVGGSLYANYYFRINNQIFNGRQTINYSTKMEEGEKYLVLFERGSPENNRLYLIRTDEYQLGEILDSVYSGKNLTLE